MHKLFKVLTVTAFIIGLFLYLGGNEAYFNKSGGTGLVIFAVGTPLFAFLAQLSKTISASNHVYSPPQSNKLFRTGIIMLTVGVLAYLSAFIGDQGFGGFGMAVLGAIVGFAGLITLFISVLKR